MVSILVLVTSITAIVIAWIFFRGREAATEGVPAGAASGAPPLAVPATRFHGAAYLHPSHAWVRVAADGTATVGATPFAANFVGALSRVETPEAGRVLRQGEPAWTLVSKKNRKLTQAMPLDGRVMEVNGGFGHARESSGAVPSHPEWILRVRPDRLARNVQNLLGGSLADAWQEVAGLKLNSALAPALGRTAQDGGVWLENFGDMLDDSDWVALQRDLFPPPPGAGVAQ